MNIIKLIFKKIFMQNAVHQCIVKPNSIIVYDFDNRRKNILKMNLYI